MSREFTVAGGRFAPGHLGELTQVLPFDLVDAVLEETLTVQRRLRDLPSRVGVYFVLAMCLFPEVGYRLVWQKLTGALAGAGLETVWPSTKALRGLRRRVGAAPVRHLFDILAGPLARPTTRGVRFGPFRTVSFDGCSSIKVPESGRNVDRFGPQSRGGYPMVELMTLVETGTRALIGAVFGPTGVGETDYARRLLHHLRPDMLVLWDKGFDANAFLADVADTGARFLGRFRVNRRTPVLTRLGDGSYLSVLGTVPVRIVEAKITVTCKDGTSFTGSYRLATTLTDAHRYPASTLGTLYHQRWEHESASLALRHTLWQGRVLRSGDPFGVEQEMWAMLTICQALRTVMVEAAESRPGTDPDRCGFTIALDTARDLVLQAEGITGRGTPGAIGRRILAALLPPRRPRVSTRKVKSPISRYHDRKTTAAPTPAASSPTWPSPSSNQSPTCPPPHTTTATPRPTTAADSVSSTSSTPNPTDTGTRANSPATSATSPWAPCADNSTGGPARNSSTKPDRPPTPARTTPCHQRECLNYPALEQAQDCRCRPAGETSRPARSAVEKKCPHRRASHGTTAPRRRRAHPRVRPRPRPRPCCCRCSRKRTDSR